MSATEQVKLQAITIGNSDFKDVIDSGTLFVDKTAHLAKLAQFKKVFLTRPRRFGKTLMLSTLQELFSHGAKDNHYFDGLAVQSLWSDPNCYPVINLSFFGLSNPKTFEFELCEHLRTACELAGFDDVSSINPNLSKISQLLGRLNIIIAGTKIVVLIDDWDYPLSANLNNFNDYEDSREILRQLFRWLRLLQNVRFTLVTGICSYENTSFFAGQEVIDISMEPLFADLVGYTEDEVKTYFAPHIKAATKLLDCSEDELLGKLKQKYDGFCFDKNASVSVYCTGSINNFFQQIVLHPDLKPEFFNFRINNANAPKAIRVF